MNVIQFVCVLFEVFYRIHVRVIQVAGVQTQACDLIRNIAHDLFNLVGELDVAACVRMDDRTDTPLVCTLAYRADVSHEARPFLVGQARRGVRMAGGVVALVVTPVHDRHVRRRELLAVVGLEHRQLRIGDEAADVVDRVEHALLIIRVEQIVEDGARHNGETVFLQLVRDQLRIDRKIAVGPELDGAVAGLASLLQHARPGRQIRILGVVYAPAARCAADLNAHNIKLLSRVS